MPQKRESIQDRVFNLLWDYHPVDVLATIQAQAARYLRKDDQPMDELVSALEKAVEAAQFVSWPECEYNDSSSDHETE